MTSPLTKKLLNRKLVDNAGLLTDLRNVRQSAESTHRNSIELGDVLSTFLCGYRMKINSDNNNLDDDESATELSVVTVQQSSGQIKDDKTQHKKTMQPNQTASKRISATTKLNSSTVKSKNMSIKVVESKPSLALTSKQFNSILKPLQTTVPKPVKKTNKPSILSQAALITKEPRPVPTPIVRLPMAVTKDNLRKHKCRYKQSFTRKDSDIFKEIIIKYSTNDKKKNFHDKKEESKNQKEGENHKRKNTS
jgi:hypothetical protein